DFAEKSSTCRERAVGSDQRASNHSDRRTISTPPVNLASWSVRSRLLARSRAAAGQADFGAFALPGTGRSGGKSVLSHWPYRGPRAREGRLAFMANSK